MYIAALPGARKVRRDGTGACIHRYIVCIYIYKKKKIIYIHVYLYVYIYIYLDTYIYYTCTRNVRRDGTDASTPIHIRSRV